MVPTESVEKQSHHPGQGQISPEQERERCEDCAARRPHDGGHEGNRERTVRREHLVRRSQVRGSTRHADRFDQGKRVEKCPLTMRHMANTATAAEEKERESAAAELCSRVEATQFWLHVHPEVEAKLDHVQHAKERAQDDMGEQFATMQFMNAMTRSPRA